LAAIIETFLSNLSDLRCTRRCIQMTPAKKRSGDTPARAGRTLWWCRSAYSAPATASGKHLAQALIWYTRLSTGAYLVIVTTPRGSHITRHFPA